MERFVLWARAKGHPVSHNFWPELASAEGMEAPRIPAKTHCTLLPVTPRRIPLDCKAGAHSDQGRVRFGSLRVWTACDDAVHGRCGCRIFSAFGTSLLPHIAIAPGLRGEDAPSHAHGGLALVGRKRVCRNSQAVQIKQTAESRKHSHANDALRNSRQKRSDSPSAQCSEAWTRELVGDRERTHAHTHYLGAHASDRM